MPARDKEENMATIFDKKAGKTERLNFFYI